VKGHDISAAALDAAEAAGVEGCATAVAAAEGADVVLTSVPTPAILRAVLTGEGGVLPVMKAGSAVVEASTVGPSAAREMGSLAHVYGVNYLDAPVSRGHDAAIAGELSILVGGEDSVISQCRPVLEAIGSTIIRVGQVGAGQIAKLTNNILSAAICAVTAEALAFGQKAGLDRAILVEAISASSGSSFVLENFFPRAFAGNFKPGGSLNIVQKDLALTLMEGTGASPLFLSAVTNEVVSLAQSKGYGELDVTTMLLLYYDLAGIPHPPP
jgi:3-hydroxyisobutyrate dehydrogenase-like beta-hydroxyacid dehydrogenase